MPTDLNDQQQRREFRKNLAQTGIDQVRHMLAVKAYNPAKTAVAEQWVKDVESGATVEDDLADIVDQLLVLKEKYVHGGNMMGLFLRAEDDSVALRLFTTALAFVDQRFGPGNMHSRQLAKTLNAGVGMSGGPSKAALMDAIELIRGIIHVSQRMPRGQSASPPLPPPEPRPGDYPLEQLLGNSSFHLKGLSDDDLARYVAGWKPGTENHIIGTRELERRKHMTTTPATAALPPPAKATYVDAKRLEEIEALPSARWDFSRLAQLCDELNAAYGDERYITTAALVRIIMDHVPPVFGFTDFDQVAANYGGPKAHRSFKGSMQHLQQSMRNISDVQMHAHIRPTDTLPTATQVDVRNDLDVLLAEVVRLGKIP